MRRPRRIAAVGLSCWAPRPTEAGWNGRRQEPEQWDHLIPAAGAGSPHLAEIPTCRHGELHSRLDESEDRRQFGRVSGQRQEHRVGTTTPGATLDVNGNINAGTAYDLGGTVFAFGSYANANANAFIGFAGNSSSTGKYNLASGSYALSSNTSGSLNTASGSYSLFTNTTGQYNTGNGNGTLYSNTDGAENTASGVAALYFNTLGDQNTATGVYALYANTTGGQNTASGVYALYSNITGSYNLANGYQALYSNTTGSENLADGYQALYSNTTGKGNNASGFQAL